LSEHDKLYIKILLSIGLSMYFDVLNFLIIFITHCPAIGMRCNAKKAAMINSKKEQFKKRTKQ